LVHEKVFAKALETLGVNWGKALPVPQFDTTGNASSKRFRKKVLVQSDVDIY
jgi:Mn-containing catalase